MVGFRVPCQGARNAQLCPDVMQPLLMVRTQGCSELGVCKEATRHFCPLFFLQGCNSVNIIGQLLCPDKPGGKVRGNFSSASSLWPFSVQGLGAGLANPTGLQLQTRRAWSLLLQALKLETHGFLYSGQRCIAHQAL